jgi:hypothetical protein
VVISRTLFIVIVCFYVGPLTLVFFRSVHMPPAPQPPTIHKWLGAVTAYGHMLRMKECGRWQPFYSKKVGIGVPNNSIEIQISMCIRATSEYCIEVQEFWPMTRLCIWGNGYMIYKMRKHLKRISSWSSLETKFIFQDFEVAQ